MKHQCNFVEPDIDAHTQYIKHLWGSVKSQNKKCYGQLYIHNTYHTYIYSFSHKEKLFFKEGEGEGVAGYINTKHTQ